MKKVARIDYFIDHFHALCCRIDHFRQFPLLARTFLTRGVLEDAGA